MYGDARKIGRFSTDKPTQNNEGLLEGNKKREERTTAGHKISSDNDQKEKKIRKSKIKAPIQKHQKKGRLTKDTDIKSMKENDQIKSG